jgi:hypothetical protein
MADMFADPWPATRPPHHLQPIPFGGTAASSPGQAYINLQQSVSVTGNYTATATDRLIYVNATSGNVTVTTPATPGANQELVVIKTDSSGNTVSLSANGGQSLIGTSTALSAQGKRLVATAVNNTTWACCEPT